MLAHILAIAVGLGSFALYMAAFFYPEVYRRNDFIWSGVGLFYALVLWICAGRITGGVLLGQMAGVALLVGLGSQLLQLRREKTPSEQQTEVSPQVRKKLVNGFAPLTKLFERLRTAPRPATVGKVEDVGEAVLETPVSEPVPQTEAQIVTPPVVETPPEPPKQKPPATPVELPQPTPVVETPPEPPKVRPPATVSETQTEKVETPTSEKIKVTRPKPPKKPAPEEIAGEEIGDFWAEETPQEDKSEVPEPAIVTNLEDLAELDRPADSLEEEMTQSFENMVSEADLTSETPKKAK
ncbi:MAG: Ycf66 family protein [Cyanobacteria bacterium SBLK]|nr:Ycf66 family protein [Cyanobacteria bacterium SBLK]